MLVIREMQMNVLAAYMVRQFENRMLLDLKRHFPGDYQTLGEGGVREMIRYGIERARSYGLVIEYDVSRYINLMFIFGKDYDTDSAFPWAPKILNDESIPKSWKMEELYEEAEKHITDVSDDINEGRNGELPVR